MEFINGVMLDPSRLLEHRSIYKQLIPLIADYGYNTIFWHFTDDHGCMLKFPSHPELASPNAYSVKEMQDFIKLANKHQIQVIPELECFGHAGYITSKKKYAHLTDGAGAAVFGAMTPFHKDTQSILHDLIKDCADIFNSPYIHAGLDEVGFGDNPASKKYLKKRKKWQAFADHCNWLNDSIKNNGKQMLMWGDHLLSSTNVDGLLDNEAMDERIADLIGKDIIICDWHYDDDVDNSSLALLKKKGFQAIACPSIMAHGSMVHPRQRNIDNIAQFSKVVHKKSNTHVLGMMNTVWCPFRYFTGTTLYGMAFAAERQVNIINDDFGARFIHKTFGIRNKSLATAFEDVHRLMPDLRHHYRMLPADKNDLDAWVFGPYEAERKTALRKAIAIIIKAEPRVKKLKDYYKDIVVSLQVTSDTLDRHQELESILTQMGIAKKKRGSHSPELKTTLRNNYSTLQKIYKQSSTHRKAAEQRWRKTRYWDDPKRTGKHKLYRYHDCFMQRLYNHENYIKKLLQENQLLMSRH